MFNRKLKRSSYSRRMEVRARRARPLSRVSEEVMDRLSVKLGMNSQGHVHWCPGCDALHTISTIWTWNGDLMHPTFEPAVRLARGGKKTPLRVCHYNLVAGQLHFHDECTHGLAGRTVPLPDLPQE